MKEKQIYIHFWGFFQKENAVLLLKAVKPTAPFVDVLLE